MTYNGTSWSSPSTVDAGQDLADISCPTASFCAEVDLHGNAIAGGVPTAIDPGNSLAAVSCSSSSFCAAADSDGNVFTYSSGSWSGADPISSGNYFDGVSCTSTSFCAAVDDVGNAFTYNGASWSGPDAIDIYGLARVSCTSASFCVAVDIRGNALIYNGASWSSPVAADGTFRYFTSVSCTSPTFCMAVDAYGNASIYNGTTWSAPVYVDDNTLVAVSCKSASFCVILDSVKSATVYTGTNAATITDVEVSGSPASPTVTVFGSGFGTQANLGTPGAPGCGPQTGSDYGSKLWIQDWTDNWVAGRGTACIGLSVSSYSDSQVVFSFGSDYSSYTLSPSASFTLNLLGATFSGNVSYTNSTGGASCTSGTTCSATLADPSQIVAVAGTKLANVTASISVYVNTQLLSCHNFAYSAPVLTLDDTGLKVGSAVSVSDKVAGLPSTKGVLICYEPVGTSSPVPTLLRKCHGKTFKGACVKSETEDAGSVVANLLVPAGDPRFHVGGGLPAVASVSTAAPKAGKKITIKGSNLSEVTTVTIGGVVARILKAAPTSVKVIAPANAHGAIAVTSVAGTITTHLTVTVV